MSNKPYLVGICGGSGSGKTFLLDQILHHWPLASITLVSQDNYYLPLEAQRKEADGLTNFDHPDSVDLHRLETDVRELMQGHPVRIQEYTFNNPLATAATIVMKPAPIIIVEGLFIYHRQSLSKLIDLKVFVEAHEHIRLARRLRRDDSERGYSSESVLRDWERFVAPMYRQFIEPTKYDCDLIIPNHSHMYRAVQVLLHHLERQFPLE